MSTNSPSLLCFSKPLKCWGRRRTTLYWPCAVLRLMFSASRPPLSRRHHPHPRAETRHTPRSKLVNSCSLYRRCRRRVLVGWVYVTLRSVGCMRMKAVCRNAWRRVAVRGRLLKNTCINLHKADSSLNQCFSTAGPWPDTGPWHQLYRAARDSRGICHFIFLSNFHEQLFYSGNILRRKIFVNVSEKLRPRCWPEETTICYRDFISPVIDN